MKAIAYSRIPEEKERAEFMASAQSRFADLRVFRFDGLAGQAGLTATLRDAEKPGVDTVVVRAFSDMGRDITTAIRNTYNLLWVHNTDLFLFTDGILFTQETVSAQPRRLVAAMHDALSYYATINRKLGMETARASGAQVGRPAILPLDSVRKDIERLTDANKGRLPSVRDLAKELGCSRTKASELLIEYKKEQDAETEHQT